MSESKSPSEDEPDGADELAALRAQHRLATSPSMESMARTRDLLDEESRVRSGIRRERRMRIAEMTERLSGVQGAMRKGYDILFDEQLQQLEADLRAELEDEMERLESEALEREERLLREGSPSQERGESPQRAVRPRERQEAGSPYGEA